MRTMYTLMVTDYVQVEEAVNGRTVPEVDSTSER